MLDARVVFDGTGDVQVQSVAQNWVTVEVAPTLAALDKTVAFIRRHLSDLPSALCEDLSLALHELLGNAMEYGSRYDQSKTVVFSCLRASRFIAFYIRDQGNGFSMALLNHSALTNPPDQPLQHQEFRDALGLRPGGYGLLLVKRIADELYYNDVGNALVFIRYL